MRLAAAWIALAVTLVPATVLEAQRDDHRYVWTHDGRTLEVEISGQVRFADDDRSVRSISPGGRFRVEERGGRGPDRAVEMRASGSSVERTYRLEGREAAFDARAAEWLATIVEEAVREMGIGADDRVARIHARGGASAVLEEVGRIRSDGGKRRHLTALVRNHRLSAPELTSTLQAIGREIDSDGDRARLLREISSSLEVDRDGVLEAYFAAVGGIDSDGDRARVLMALLDDGEVSEALLLALLESATAIDSDGDKARVMMRIPLARLRSEAVGRAYLAALRTIESDGDRARVAMRLMEGRS